MGKCRIAVMRSLRVRGGASQHRRIEKRGILMHVSRKVVATLALVSAVASGALVTVALAASGDSANGHGTLDGSRQFSFSARTQADGTVSGNAVLNNPAFQVDGRAYQLQIDISCMKVVGNIAIFGGTTKRTNDPSLVDAVFFSVQDNGEPGRQDKISRVFFWDDDPNTTGDPQACLLVGAADFPLEPIERGNIQVRPALP
jgi:hypothetical protein